MNKMDTVKAVVVNRGRALAEKAKDVTEIAKLKAQIMSCEEIIRKNYLEIGKKVYEAYEELDDDECTSVFNQKSDHKIDQEFEREYDQEYDKNGMEGACHAAEEETDIAVRPQAWEERYKKQCVAIGNAYKAIEDLKRRISEIQGKE